MHAVSPKDQVPSLSPESVVRDRRHQKHRRQVLGSRHGTPAPIRPSVLESRASGPPSLTVDPALVTLVTEGIGETEAASNSWDGFSFPATPSTCDGDLSPTFSPRVFSPGGNISPHGSSPAFSPRIPSPRLPSGAAHGAAPGNGRTMESQRRAFSGCRRGAVPPTRLQRDTALVGSPRGDASTSSKAQDSPNLVTPKVLSAIRPSAHRDSSHPERTAFQGTPDASAVHSGGHAGAPASRGPLARVRPAASTAAGGAHGVQMRGPRPPSLILPSQCGLHTCLGTSATHAAVRAAQAVNDRTAAAAVSPAASADSAAASPSSFASSPPAPSAAAASPSALPLASTCAESPRLLHPRSACTAPSPPPSASASPRLLQASRPRAPSAHSSPRPCIPERTAQYASHDQADLPRAASFHHPPARRRESDAPIAQEAADLARARSFHRPPSQLQPKLSPSAARHTRLPFPLLPLTFPRSPTHPAPRSCPPARLLAEQPLRQWGGGEGGGRGQEECEVMGWREKWVSEASGDRERERREGEVEEEGEEDWGTQKVGRGERLLQGRNVIMRTRQPQRRASFGGQSDAAMWQRVHDGMPMEEADVPMWRLVARALAPPSPTPPSQAPPSAASAQLKCHTGPGGVAASCTARERVGGGAVRRDEGDVASDVRGFGGITQLPERIQDHSRYSHSATPSPQSGCAQGTCSVVLPPPVRNPTAPPTHALMQPCQQEGEDEEEGEVPMLAIPRRAHSARCTATTAPTRSPLSPAHHRTHSSSFSHLHRSPLNPCSPLNSPTSGSRSGTGRQRGADVSICVASPRAIPSQKALTAPHSSPQLVTDPRVLHSPRSPSHSRSQSALNSPTVCHTDPSSSADAGL
ncbi:unnamed protein product [Closterium sp. NIES-53]